MKVIYPIATSICLLTTFAVGIASAEETKEATAKVCAITGKAANAEFSTIYEDQTYTFCSTDCVDKFKEQRAASLYEKIGGKAALTATVNLFYKKVLADKRVNHFFEDVNMRRQHNKQQAFIAAALGAPEPWTGKDLRKAHASMDLTEKDFGVIAEHLQSTLEELEVPKDLIGQVMSIVGSTKDAVLNRDEPTE